MVVGEARPSWSVRSGQKSNRRGFNSKGGFYAQAQRRFHEEGRRSELRVTRASVNLELEFDSSLVGDPKRLRERIKQLFVMAKTSVAEELAGAKSNGSCANGHHGDDQPDGQAHDNGHAAGRRRDGTRPATASQVRALGAIAERQGIELGDKLHARFGVRNAADLTITEASGLIDELKNATGG
jgi:hypothetical protein